MMQFRLFKGFKILMDEHVHSEACSTSDKNYNVNLQV